MILEKLELKLVLGIIIRKCDCTLIANLIFVLKFFFEKIKLEALIDLVFGFVFSKLFCFKLFFENLKQKQIHN